MAVPKFKVSLVIKYGLARVTHSDTRPHFTVQSARQNSLVTGKRTIEKGKVCIVKCNASVYEPISF